MKKILKIITAALLLLTSVATMPVAAQKIVYNQHTKNGARVLETSRKKLGVIGKGNKKFYMWTSLTSLDIKGITIYTIKAMYTSEYHLSIEKGAPLVLTLKDGTELELHSAAAAESRRLDGVETVFASYEVKEEDLIEATRKGIIKVAPTVTCFGQSKYEESISMWKLARPLALRYDLLKEYIDKHPE